MKIKKLLALMLAALMVVTLCIPAGAATQDIPCCDEPWTENPEYGDWYLVYSLSYHIWERHVVYYCTHCGEYYIEEDYYEEPHDLEDYMENGKVVGEWCPVCGIIFRTGE